MLKSLGQSRPLRSIVFLATLLVVIVAALSQEPAKVNDTPSLVIRLIQLTVFCFAGYLLSASRRWLVIYLAIAIPALIFGALEAIFFGNTWLVITSLVFSTALLLLLFQAILSFSLFNSEASQLDRILAGICGYLLLALFWSSFYQALCTLQPGAIISSQSGAVPPLGPDLLYFSIVTLTTLGYGDMAPGPNSMARLLCSTQALVGTLYLAVFVGSLLNSGGTHGKRDGSGDSHETK
jgi:hypothetical protein